MSRGRGVAKGRVACLNFPLRPPSEKMPPMVLLTSDSSSWQRSICLALLMLAALPPLVRKAPTAAAAGAELKRVRGA